MESHSDSDVTEEVIPKGAKGFSDTAASLDIAKQKAKKEKDQIRLMLQERSERISLKTNPLKSKVWSSFKLVLLDGKNTNFVKCNDCPEIYAWIAGGGTTSLRRHVCSTDKTKASTSTQPIIALLPKTVPESSKQGLNRAIVIGLAKDLRPLGSANSRGFLQIAQSLVNLGARNGQVEVKKAIFNRTTLKRYVLPDVVKDVKQKVVDSLRGVAVQCKISFTMDLWTDKYQSRSFLSLTAHFFEDNFELKHALLGCEEFPHEFKGTENVRNECSRILRGFFPEDVASKMLETAISVTDSGSNVTRVFKIRKPCQCHKINNFLGSLFSSSNMDEKFPQLQETFQAIKKLVRYAKKSGMNKDLGKSLKQAVPTRWLSELAMVDSYIQSVDDVKTKLEDKHELKRLDKIDFSAAQDFSKLMQPFDECLKAFQTDRAPTIQLVAVWFSNLHDHMQIQVTDSELIKSIKSEAQHLFNRYLVTDQFYLAACLLNPISRTLKFAGKEKADEAKEFLKTLIDQEQILEKQTTTSLEPTKKKPKTDFGALSRLFDSDEDEDDENVAEKNELEVYLAMPIPYDLDKTDPNFVAAFWKRQTKLPKLRRVASWMLAIPASSASDERVFSATGYTLTPRRTSLEGSTLADMTFIHFNAD